MALSFAGDLISQVKDKSGKLIGIWVKETATWDGTETSYYFPNAQTAQHVMEGHLWRLKSWVVTSSGIGSGHYLYMQQQERMTDASSAASHVLGRFLWADTEAFGLCYDVGPLHDGKVEWTATSRLLTVTGDTALTAAGTTEVLAFYEKVD